MSADHIRTEQDGAILTVTLANEARRNALGSAALIRLSGLASEIAAQPEIRAVVLTGAGERAFTSGFDLTELGEFTPDKFITNRFAEVFEAWARLPVPVIGALNGACMGGGVHVAVICDALVSVPGVRFMIPAARFGFIYVPESIRRITATLGPALAARLLYLNDELTAEDLAPSGVVSRIVEPADLLATARAIAGRTTGLAPLAVAGMKEMVREAPDRPRIEELVHRCAHSEDVLEGLAAMREKRAPLFTGQ